MGIYPIYIWGGTTLNQARQPLLDPTPQDRIFDPKDVKSSAPLVVRTLGDQSMILWGFYSHGDPQTGWLVYNGTSCQDG